MQQRPDSFAAALMERVDPIHAGAPKTALLYYVAAVVMALLHLWQTFVFFLPAGQFKTLHLGLALLLTYLDAATRAQAEGARRQHKLFLALGLLSMVPIVYILQQYTLMVTERSFLPNQLDLWMAALLLIVAIFAVWKEWGASIPVIAILSLLYAYYGYLLPGILNHGGIGLGRIIGTTSIPYFRGLLGNLTGISASTIFLFMLFAGLLKSTGGLDYIMRAAFGLVGQMRSGPAQAAIVSSGFFGSISGSIMANVASTGAFTIPLMKKTGFQPHFAGAVEATASTGGQITPPKLGLTAFLIVGLTGIPYSRIMEATVLPALLFYAFLMWSVHLRAKSRGIDARATAADLAGIPMMDIGLGRATLLNLHLILAVVVLVWMLVTDVPAGTSALYADLTIIVLEVVKRMLLGRFRLAAVRETALVLLHGLITGARSGAMVAVIIAVISIMIEFVVVTGFAQKLSYGMLDLSGGVLWRLMPLAALACLAFGVGLPTSAAYILVALLGAPAMVKAGVPLLAAHLFVFYYAIMSALTPPVAVGSLVASNLAKASFWKTSFAALRLAVPGFLLPFLFVAQPGLIGIDASALTQLWLFLVALLGLCALSSAIEGYAFVRLHPVERILLLPAAFGMILPGALTDAIGLALLAAICARQVIALRRAPAPINPMEGQQV